MSYRTYEELTRMKSIHKLHVSKKIGHLVFECGIFNEDFKLLNVSIFEYISEIRYLNIFHIQIIKFVFSISLDYFE